MAAIFDTLYRTKQHKIKKSGDFIKKIASRGGGKVYYLIHFKDGKTLKLRDWLWEHLSQLEHGHPVPLNTNPPGKLPPANDPPNQYQWVLNNIVAYPGTFSRMENGKSKSYSPLWRGVYVKRRWIWIIKEPKNLEEFIDRCCGPSEVYPADFQLTVSEKTMTLRDWLRTKFKK